MAGVLSSIHLLAGHILDHGEILVWQGPDHLLQGLPVRFCTEHVIHEPFQHLLKGHEHQEEAPHQAEPRLKDSMLLEVLFLGSWTGANSLLARGLHGKRLDAE